MIPFLDLGAATAELKNEIEAAISRVVNSGRYIGGEECTSFEQAFASYCEAEHCVGVGNGLDALILSLRALGIGNGDEVIVASNTFIATTLAITAVGAKAVAVEPDERTYNIDPALVEKAITPATRAIMPTHLYGQSADIDALLAITRRHGLRLIEDAAQAHGARYNGRRLGAHGDIVCWSFYPGKNLGAMGDGGAITTNDGELADKVRVLGNYGSSRKYVNKVRGVNSRLDPLQAAVLSVKLAYLDIWNARRAAIADQYSAALTDTGVTTPYVPGGSAPAWHLYVVRSKQRDALQQRLGERGVQTLIHYPIPPHLQEAYADRGWHEGQFPIAERLAREVLSLPIGPQLDGASVSRVIGALKEIHR